MEIEVPYSRDSKNYWVYKLENGVYIITVYLPKTEHDKESKVTVNVE